MDTDTSEASVLAERDRDTQREGPETEESGKGPRFRGGVGCKNEGVGRVEDL